ncbi:MAG: LuxR C-terminal-related transcriptional regulator [Nitrospira sp.]
MQRMTQRVRRLKKPTAETFSASLSPYQRPTELTKREHMILNQLWLGAQNQTIAHELNFSVRTVEAHRAMIMRKFGVTNVAQLLRAALLGGVLQLR